MAEQKIRNQWQLEETGESLEQWKLQDDEQRLPSHMQLQDDYSDPEMMDAAWQPIDYRAMQAAAAGKPRRGGMALGALLVVALLGVVGYLAWFYMGQADTDAPAAATDQAALVADGERSPDAVDLAAVATDPLTGTTEGSGAAAPANQSAQTEAPAAADTAPAAGEGATSPVAAVELAAPIVAPVPALPATAEVRQATINSQFGVNLRAEAAATATLLATLDDKTTHVVVSGPTTDAAGATWYELAQPDKTRGWVSGDFITVTVQNLPYADAEALLASVGMTLAAPAAEAAPSVSVTATAPITDGAPIAPGATGAAPVGLSAVITAPAGLNLRSAAESGDNVIEQLLDGAAVTVIGRSADGAWLQIELPDGKRGWVSSEFVTVTGDLNTIPAGTSQPLTPTAASVVTGALAAVQPAAAITGTAATGAAALAAPADAAPAPAATGGGAAFTVTSIMGVNVRPQPSNDSPGIVQLSWNTSGTASGRTADGNWVQVTIPSGQSGWVAEVAVTLDREVSSLPVIQ